MKKWVPLIIAIIWMLLLLYLSFQNGTETSATSSNFTIRVLRLFMNTEPDVSTIVLWDARFRLWAHFVLFFVFGILSTDAAYQWIQTHQLAFTMTFIINILIAVISEVGKLGISGRHFQASEMCLNIVGALLGCFIVRLLYAAAARRKNWL